MTTVLLNNAEIGKRLREFGKDRFGAMEKFAAALEMTPQSLNNYLKGLRLPGAKIISKLKKLGCDTDWLLLNKEETELENKSEKENNESDLTKDNIILSQAEEIFLLKSILKELSIKINKLERMSLNMEKVVMNEKGLKPINKIK